jgi:hypothetical protein
MDMEPAQLDCTRVEEGEYELRYIQGVLSEADAEAFEAHYFECERCWAALQRALDLHGALAAAGQAATGATAGSSVPVRLQGTTRRRWEARWWPVLAAAAALVMVGTWRIHRRSANEGIPAEAERGVAAGLRVRPLATPDRLAVTWSAVRGADRYRAQLFAADGTRMADREVSDTSVSVPRDTLGGASLIAGAYWSVEALDATRHTLAKSRLTAALTTPNP